MPLARCTPELLAAPAVMLTLFVSTAGCGSSNPAGPSTTPPATFTAAPTPTPVVIPSGDNWTFRVAGFSGTGLTSSLGRAAPLTALEGAFNTSSDSPEGYFSPFGSCFNSDRDRAQFRGTKSGTSVQLESLPMGNAVIRLSGTLSAAGDSFDGTVSMTGCGTSSAPVPIVGRRVNYAGRWIGSMGDVGIVADLQMASRPDDRGGFEVTGSVVLSNTTCFPNAAMVRRGYGRVLFPDISGPPHRMELIAELDEALRVMDFIYVLVEGTCPALRFGDGQLTRQ